MTTETPTAAPAATETVAPAVAPVVETPADTPPATPAAVEPPTGDKPADPAKPEDKPQGAPEEYAEFTAPEGVTFNPDTITELKAFAKEKNLSQEDAQKLVDLGVKNAQNTAEALDAQIQQVRKEWGEASRADKEFGGDKLDENLAVAKRALDAFGTPELTALLKETGLGDHPEINRAFFRVGKAISEDRLVPGGKVPDGGGDVAKKLYPSMNS